MGNTSGLGRLSRIYLLALAGAAPQWELHLYLREPYDVALLREECDQGYEDLLTRFTFHYPPLPGLNRLLLEEWHMPRVFKPLGLDCYLGCDFTLPPRPLAPREVVILPDMLPFSRPRSVSWRARLLYRRGIRKSAARASCLLCISRRTRESLLSYFPALHGEARVVYPALSPRLFQLARKQRLGDHAMQVHGSLHNLSTSGRFILAVGVSGPRKNTGLLVGAYNDLVLGSKYRGSLVLVGGDGRFHTAPPGPRLALETAGFRPPESEQHAAIHDLGRVSDNDLSQLYSHADLLASFSTEEGFGFPVLEALAHGTPALVTRGSSMAEIAARGIAETGLRREECVEKLAAMIAALPVLRREAAQLPEQAYSIERLGRELVQALCGGDSEDAC